MTFRAALLAFSLTVPAMAAAQDTEIPAIDPKAVEIAERSMAFVTAAPKISVSYFVTYDQVFEGREKITFVRSGSNTLVRGTGFYAYAERNDRVREYFHDGKIFTAAAPGDGFYASVPFEGDFDSLVVTLQDEFGVTLPIWEMLSATLKDDFLAEIEAARYLGTTLIAGKEAHHLAFSEYDEDFQIWISTDEDEPVPLMVVGTNPYAQGWPQFHAFFYGWTTEPKVEDGLFTFSPGENDRKVNFAAYAERGRAAEDAASDAAAPAKKN